MRKLLLLALIATACSGGDSGATSVPTTAPATTTTAPETTTSTSAPVTTTSASSTTSTTTTTSLPPSFVSAAGFGYSLSVPGDWQADPDFGGVGEGFVVSNTGVGLPPSRYSVSFTLLAEALTPGDHVAGVVAEASSGENFAVLTEGTGEIAGSPTAYVEYVETLFGFDFVRRVEALVTGNRLVVFDLLTPVDVFESQEALAAIVAGTFELQP
jgi:hypothetical protein